MNYEEKLKDPRWQKKRLEMLELHGWKCWICENDKDTLHVHHLNYRKDAEPWEYDEGDLVVLCEECHEVIHGKYRIALFASLKEIAIRSRIMAIINMQDDEKRLDYLEDIALRLELHKK